MLTVTNSLIFAQDSIPEEIRSIGKFEIGITTISIIGELEKELKTKVKECASSIVYIKAQESGTNYILQLINDVSNKYSSPPQASNCENVAIYSIGGYSVANIELKDLELAFLNDTLIGLKCDRTPEFIEAVHLKYGYGRIQKEEQEVTCEVGRLGTEVMLKKTAIYESWGQHDIRATATLSVYYNSKCEKKYLSYFILTSLSASKERRSCEDLKKEELKKRDEEQKKKSLDGF